MRTIKIVGRNYIFSPLCLITKESAINHECVMVTKSLHLGLHDLPGIINNKYYAYSGRLLK